MDIKQKKLLIDELRIELGARIDGSGRNLIASKCPSCGKKEKFGINISNDDNRVWRAQCFSCGLRTSKDNPLKSLLEIIGREDLMPNESIDVFKELEVVELKSTMVDDDEDLEVELEEVELPEGYERTYYNSHLENDRGFWEEDYDFFEVGTATDFKFRDYIIFPIETNGVVTGFLARHEWKKEKLEKYNKKAKMLDEYQLLRYKNSKDNEFSMMLFNYDAIIEDVTYTVIMFEGGFNAIAGCRKLYLYDNEEVVVSASFGKKLSDIQMYMLQKKGVKNLIIAFDGDAVGDIKSISNEASKYFNVLIADSIDPFKDTDDMTEMEVFETFCNLKTPREFFGKLNIRKLKN